MIRIALHPRPLRVSATTPRVPMPSLLVSFLAPIERG